MAYLYEDKELVYEKRMASLKKRIILVNVIIFVTNLLATLILIFNNMSFMDFLTLVLPVFLLNLVISYALVINRDSNEQLYLAMYISIIGTIVVMINIFINVKSPATYMLIYLAIAIISVYKDKKAVTLGYAIIFFFGTIIHFKHTSAIIGINWNDYLTNDLTPYLYECILLLILTVQFIRTVYNEREIDELYNQLENYKDLELKYQSTIINLMEEDQLLGKYTDNYTNDITKLRFNKYFELINESFYIKGDLNEKFENYLNLQRFKSPHKVTGKRIGSYQFKKELSQFDEMSTFKLSKMISIIMNIGFSNTRNSKINSIKNYDTLFNDPDMTIEVKLIGFLLLYEHLRNEKDYLISMSHEQIVDYFKKNNRDLIDKEVIEFFIKNEKMIREIYEAKTSVNSETVE